MKMFMSNTSSVTIRIEDVERKTDSNVWIHGRMNKRVTDYESFHDTFQESKCYLLNLLENRVKEAESMVEYRKQSFMKALEIKDPTTV